MALVSVPTFDRDLFKGAVDRLHEDLPPAKRQKRALADSTEATQSFVDLDLLNDDESEDEGEIMLLAMILLQIHGVKLPSASIPDLDQNKKKRQRTSPEQLAILEQIFQTDKMPSQQTRIHLADQLGMSSRRVQIWFQNKRAKVKRGLNKSTEIDDVSSPDEEAFSAKGAFSSPLFESLSSPLSSSESSDNHAALSSATRSTLSLLNSSSSLVPSHSPKKAHIAHLRESTGSYADITAKRPQM